MTMLDQGVKTIRDYVQVLPDTPGVYRMLSADDAVLYVGKARSLKARVSSYTQVGRLPVRLQRMVAQTRAMEFVQTRSEAEALLLESNLIKTLKPRYNILLRDDKSFPHILITGDHDFPMVTKHRGVQKRAGQYYGPFAGAGDVNRTIAILQRVCMLRNCTDHVFANRTRPCLQYHIKRCSAPCVDKVSQKQYAQQVKQARDFLEGKSEAVKEDLARDMQQASVDQRYEDAVLYRDRIQALSAVQAHQDVNIEGIGDADILALACAQGRSCVQVFFFRGGRNYGNRSYFPKHDVDRSEKEILSAFIAQFYENKPAPRHLLVSHAVAERALLEEALTLRAQRRVEIVRPARGDKARAVAFALQNAQGSLARRSALQANESQHLAEVAELFGLEDPPQRIEVYDNSHIAGTNMVGAMIVAGPEGLQKSSYRKFNIKQAGASDDYGMMREVLSRRFKKVLSGQGDIGGEDWPDLLLIDGGKGQLSAVTEVLEEYGIADALCVVAIAKGEDRNAGRETFFMAGRSPFQVSFDSPVLHYLQRLRDEAHRFAVESHRKRRNTEISRSPLDDIPGIGKARKKAILAYFGSAKAVVDATLEDLEKIRGVSKNMAQNIYDHFH